MNVFKKSTVSIAFNVIGALFALLTQFIAAKLLGVVEFGKWNYFIGMVNSMIFLFSFGISFYFPTILQNSINPREIFSKIFFGFTILFVLIFPIYLYVSNITFEYNFLLILLSSYALISIGYYRAFLIGLNKTEVSAKINNFYLKVFILILFLIIYLLFDRSSLSLIYANLLGHFVLLLVVLKKNLKKVSPSILFLKESFYFYLIQLFYGFFNEYSKVIQADLFDYETVSFLSIALIISQVIILFSQNIANVSMPLFNKLYQKKNFNEMKKVFRNVTRLNAFFLLPLFFLLFFNSNLILSMIDEDYVGGTLMLRIILVGTLFGSLVGPNGSLLLMTNKSKYELANGILKISCFLIILNSYSKNYIWGLALCITLSEIIVNSSKAIQVYLLYKILPYNQKDAIYLSVIGIISTIIFYSFSQYFSNKLFAIIPNFISLAILWLVAFYFSPNKEDREFLINRLSLKFKRIR